MKLTLYYRPYCCNNCVMSKNMAKNLQKLGLNIDIIKQAYDYPKLMVGNNVYINDDCVKKLTEIWGEKT